MVSHLLLEGRITGLDSTKNRRRSGMTGQRSVVWVALAFPLPSLILTLCRTLKFTTTTVRVRESFRAGGSNRELQGWVRLSRLEHLPEATESEDRKCGNADDDVLLTRHDPTMRLPHSMLGCD